MNGAAFASSVIDHRSQTRPPTNTGQSIFVMREDLFMPAEDMQRSVPRHLDELRNSGSASGDPVRLPGDRSAEVWKETNDVGIEVPGPVLSPSTLVATGLGVPPLT